MSLLCYYEGYPGDGWGFWKPEKFTMLNTKHRRRCKSCGNLIDIGSMCVEIERFQFPQNEIQCRIYGDWDVEIDLASYWLCESCGEIWFNLEALGYCLDPEGDMRENLREYWELTGFKPSK